MQNYTNGLFNKGVSKLSAKIVLVFLFISPRFLINTEQEKNIQFGLFDALVAIDSETSVRIC